jgi:hypothetical protein
MILVYCLILTCLTCPTFNKTLQMQFLSRWTYYYNYISHITSCIHGAVFHEKLVAQMIKNNPAIYETLRFFTVPTKVRL